VKNAVYLLNQKASDPARHDEYFGIVTRETERISRIIHQMLGLYRPQMNRDLIDVGVVLNDAVSLIHPNLNNSRTHVEIPPPGSAPPVHASDDQLRQVFLNLLLNAADASGDGGVIRVTTTVVQQSPSGTRGPFVATAFSDNGQGIDPKHLPNLFDPFFSTKREKLGAGLGLWISKDIITQHGGEIHAESRVGKGTTFTVLLPVGERP
jgi:two-component system NtrC family sensor kinase